MQFSRLPSELLTQIGSYLPTHDNYLENLLKKPHVGHAFMDDFISIIKNNTDLDLTNNILRYTILTFYPQVRKYLLPFSDEELLKNSISLKNILEEIESWEKWDNDQLVKNTTVLSLRERMVGETSKPLFENIDEKTEDYYFLSKALNKYKFSEIDDSFRLIMLSPNVDPNFIPSDDFDPLIVLSVKYGDTASFEILAKDSRIIDDRLMALMTVVISHDLDSYKQAKILIDNSNFSPYNKEEALEETWGEITSEIEPEDYIGEGKNVILLLVEDPIVNPSIANNSTIIKMMRESEIMDFEEHEMTILKEDIDILMSHPKFDFNEGYDKVMETAKKYRFTNVIDKFNL